MKTKTKHMLLISFTILMGLSIIKIINYYVDMQNSTIELPVVSTVDIVPTPENTPNGDLADDDSTHDSVMIPEYTELYEQNPDMVGRIIIPNTSINYPIMCSIDDSDYYLNHDFNKNENRHGSIFLGKDSCIDSNTILLYGHYMKDGTMFADLYKFLDEEFFNENSYLEIHSLYEKKNYQVIAVFKDYVHTVSDTSFKFYNYYGEPDEEKFKNFKEFLINNSIYSRDLDALTYGDNVAQLITCSYHVDNGRLVVVCKEV